MNLIFKLFCSDIKGLAKNLFALIVAGGLCIIPSLYAWFNIYSNWDPYGNTNAIRIAVYSEDTGYQNSDGTYMNMGDSIIDNLKQNDKLGWVFVNTNEEAMKMVESGECYAAIIIGNSFSQSMYEFIDNGMAKPSVTYYENAKKNAVASKITQSGKSSLEESINSEFINTVVTTIMKNMDGALDKDSDILVKIVNKLKNLNENLIGYDDTVAAFQDSNNALSATLENAVNMLGEAQNTLLQENLNQSKTQTNDAVTEYIAKFDNVLLDIKTSGEATIETIQKLRDAVDGMYDINISEQLDKNIQAVDNLIAKNEVLMEQLINIGNQIGNDIIVGELKNIVGTLSELEKSVKTALEMAKELSGGVIDLTEVRKTIVNLLDNSIDRMNRLMEIYNGAISNAVSDVQNLIKNAVDNIYTSLEMAGSSIGTVETMINGLNSGMSGVNTTLNQIEEMLTGMSEKLTTFIHTLESASENERYDIMMNFLTKDSSVFGTFFASPVQVVTENVYEAVNYGTAVSPFYTTLALWVGGLLLTALIKVAPQKKGFLSEAKEYQLYFGRYLLFFVMGQIQAVITVVGDLYLLKIQCLHPGLFMVAASVTSFTFTLLIYTLTLSFGDIGKAFAVVMVVLQIAGSSGTFPIELLPDFFQKIYLYFPFPYAINAMREAVSGTYQNDFGIYLLWLMVFVMGSLLLGLVLRKPFINLNHFMHKRMHDTEMM